MQDVKKIKEAIATLMVGGEEHADLFQEIRTWAVRNEARINTSMNHSESFAEALHEESKRWDLLIKIFDSIAMENNLKLYEPEN